MGVVLSAGGAFAWYRDQLARDLVSTGEANERLNAEAATIPPGAEGVTFLPYLQGRADATSRARRCAATAARHAESRPFAGASHASGDRRRCASALRDSVQILSELGTLSSAHAPDGRRRASAAFVCRMQAEVFGVPVCTVNREEGPAYGAALLAAVGVGAFPDLAAAARGDIVRQGSARSALTRPCMRRTTTPYQRFRGSYGAARPGCSFGGVIFHSRGLPPSSRCMRAVARKVVGSQETGSLWCWRSSPSH